MCLLQYFDTHSRHQFSASLFDLLKSHINEHAAYNSRERKAEHASICHEGTREKVLEGIMAWAQEKNGPPVCWLHGPAGCGKSTIAHTIAHDYDKLHNLAFSFFFSRRNLDRSDATKFFLTFAYQLAIALPSASQPMRDALMKDPSIPNQCPEDQLTKLIVDPVLLISDSIPRLIVIDSLDECGSEDDLKELIQLLVCALPKLPFRLLFTSRPEAYIEAIFTNVSPRDQIHCITLRDFDAIRDVYNYLHMSLSKVQTAWRLPSSWPSEANLSQLAEKSESIFIYASTLVKFVDDKYDDPRRKLEIALKAHKGLDSLFKQVLGDAKKYHHFKQVLGAIIFLRGNPHLVTLPWLLQVDSVYDVRLALRGCLSILLVPDSDDDYVRPYHASLLDFLTDPERGKDQFFDVVECNSTIVMSCIKLITADSDCDAASLHYAYQHWCHHFHMVLSNVKDVGHVQSKLEPSVTHVVMTVLLQFKKWMIRLEEPDGVQLVFKDLHSAVLLIKVCQSILHAAMSNMLDKGTMDSS
jgi:hypothetical protein